MATKNLFVNSVAGLFSMGATVALGIILKIILTRDLSPEQLGVFFTGQTLFGMCTFLASLGMSDAIARFAGFSWKKGAPETVATLARGLRLGALAGLVLGTLLVLGRAPLIKYAVHDPAFSKIVVLFAVCIPFKVTADLIGAAYQGTGRLYYKMIVADLAPAVLYTIGLELLNLRNAASLAGVVAVYVVPMMISPFLFQGAAKISAIRESRAGGASYRDILDYSLPLLGSGIVAWPLTLVPLFICSMTSAEEVSYYNLAISLGSLMYIGVGVTEAAGLSVWSTYLAADEPAQLREDYRLATRWSLILGSVVFIMLLLCTHEIVLLLYGPKYGGLVKIVPTIGIIFFANLLTGPNESILKAYGKTRYILLTRIVSSAIVLVTLYPFLRWWGLWGAIIAYGLAMLCSILMYSVKLYIMADIHPFDTHYYRTVAAIGGSALLTMGMLRVPGIDHWRITAIIAGAITIYGIFMALNLAAFGAISPRDRLMLSRVAGVWSRLRNA